ncbi:hypothetical protein Q7P35_006922 [Cladosporium inversicolor]
MLDIFFLLLALWCHYTLMRRAAALVRSHTLGGLVAGRRANGRVADPVSEAPVGGRCCWRTNVSQRQSCDLASTFKIDDCFQPAVTPTPNTTIMAAPPPPPQWVLDLNSTSPTKPRTGAFPDPPGFTSTTTLQQSKPTKGGKAVTPRAKPSPEEMETLKLKKAWEVAIAPAKQLPMNAIGMYMSGNSLQMFSIMMVFMLFKAPIQALMNINQTFARFESDGKKQEMLMVKAAFVGCNLLALALGTWKVNQMGLLPTTRSDWLAWEVAREPLERAYFIPS